MKTILFVNDNRTVINSYPELLEKDFNCEVKAYESARDARNDIVNGLKFDLGIIDLSLSPEDIAGDNIIKFIHKRNQYIPLISFSAYDYKLPEVEENIVSPIIWIEFSKKIRKYLI